MYVYNRQLAILNRTEIAPLLAPQPRSAFEAEDITPGNDADDAFADRPAVGSGAGGSPPAVG